MNFQFMVSSRSESSHASLLFWLIKVVNIYRDIKWMVGNYLKYILHKLAKMRDRANIAYVRDPRFRGLCNDYGEAIEALERWKFSFGPAAAQRASEYRELIAGLEDEILHEIRGYCDQD
jgi:hypothetical protein